MLPGIDGAQARVAADSYNAFEKLRDPSHGRALGLGEWRVLPRSLNYESPGLRLKPRSAK